MIGAPPFDPSVQAMLTYPSPAVRVTVGAAGVLTEGIITPLGDRPSRGTVVDTTSDIIIGKYSPSLTLKVTEVLESIALKTTTPSPPHLTDETSTGPATVVNILIIGLLYFLDILLSF